MWYKNQRENHLFNSSRITYQHTTSLSSTHRQRGATQVLRKLLQDWTDEDLCLGASQLLGILGASAAPPHSAAPATHAHSNVHAASNAHAASNVHTASATQPAHSNVQASPSTSALPSSHAPHTPSSAPPHSTGRSASLNGTAIANGPPSHANGSAFAAPTALHCDASHTGASSHSNSGSAGDASAGDQNQDRRGDGFVSTISHGLEGSGTSLSSVSVFFVHSIFLFYCCELQGGVVGSIIRQRAFVCVPPLPHNAPHCAAVFLSFPLLSCLAVCCESRDSVLVALCV